MCRGNPAPPPIPPSSTALTELSLAHRRLSAKLDLTESQLAASQLELAAAKQEVHRLHREREGDRATINEMRRVEDDRDEEVEWERGERRKMEEQKRLRCVDHLLLNASQCHRADAGYSDLALQEYEKLVHSLDSSAVPPELPEKVSCSSNILRSTPDLANGADLPTPRPTSPSSTAESISSLLIGQRGVHRLFNDFITSLAAKEKALHQLTARIEEMEYSLSIMRDQLTAETGMRVQAQTERDKALRDDASAAKVVERYMTFTQKTHATMHMHLDNLRTRSSSTQTTLRKEVMGLSRRLQAETERSQRLRPAMDEMSESLSREAVGRRREVALRLHMLATQEKMERKVEVWLDRVRRAREGAEGAVLEPDLLEGLLDEGVEAMSQGNDRTDISQDKQRGWRGMLGKKKQAQEAVPDTEQASLTRVLLAEELVNSLVEDLQEETGRRMELERQRVEWLAREAVHGMDPDEGKGEVDGQMVFDAENHEEEDGTDRLLVLPRDEDETPRTEHHDMIEVATPPLPSPLLNSAPLIGHLRDLFDPLTARHSPLQKTLHDLSLSLTSLRASLPLPPAEPDTSLTKWPKTRSPCSRSEPHCQRLTRSSLICSTRFTRSSRTPTLMSRSRWRMKKGYIAGSKRSLASGLAQVRYKARR